MPGIAISIASVVAAIAGVIDTALYAYNTYDQLSERWNQAKEDLAYSKSLKQQAQLFKDNANKLKVLQEKLNKNQYTQSELTHGLQLLEDTIYQLQSSSSQYSGLPRAKLQEALKAKREAKAGIESALSQARSEQKIIQNNIAKAEEQGTKIQSDIDIAVTRESSLIEGLKDVMNASDPK